MLKIQFRDARQKPVWVVENTFAIGSASDNNLVIRDDSVSSHHARLTLEDGRFLLHDLNSSRGTFVNEGRVNKRQVGCDDCIRLGDVELEVVDPLKDEKGDEKPYWALVASASWLAGQEFPLTPKADKTVLVGRGTHCDLVFPGTHLSREHAQIKLAHDHILLEDLDSANGTYLNDQRVTGTVEARAGDRLRLDIYNFILLGPGMKLPQSTAQHKRIEASMAEPEYRESAPRKRWKTRPTSPGNREEPPSTAAPDPFVLWSCMLLIVALLGSTVYFLLP